jgi:hypothetical protein
MSFGTESLPPSPRKEDKLFRGDLPDWHNNACLGSYGDSVAYTEGYRRGAELLVQHVVDHHSDQDYLVYPIIFLYRHHLELALKRIISRSPRLLSRELTQEEKAHLQKHRLDLLWQDLKPMFAGICEAVEWDKPEVADVEGADAYIQQLTELDRNSLSFRYWQSKAGERSLPEDLQRINLRHFAEMMNRLVRYIDGIDSATSLVEDWQDDMESSYGNDYGY